MANPKSNDAIVTVITKRINGVQKYLKGEKVDIPVNGALVKPATLLRLYQNSLDARAAVTAGHAAYQGALRKREAAEADRFAVDESLKGWVLARFGAGSVEASEFGFQARKAPVVTAETRAAAVAKNKATRQARGTVGRRKKLKIKGVVPTPPAPAAPAMTPASVPSPTLVALPALLTAASPAVTPAVTPPIAVSPAAPVAAHA